MIIQRRPSLRTGMGDIERKWMIEASGPIKAAEMATAILDLDAYPLGPQETYEIRVQGAATQIAAAMELARNLELLAADGIQYSANTANTVDPSTDWSSSGAMAVNSNAPSLQQVYAEIANKASQVRDVQQDLAIQKATEAQQNAGSVQSQQIDQQYQQARTQQEQQFQAELQRQQSLIDSAAADRQRQLEAAQADLRARQAALAAQNAAELERMRAVASAAALAAQNAALATRDTEVARAADMQRAYEMAMAEERARLAALQAAGANTGNLFVDNGGSGGLLPDKTNQGFAPATSEPGETNWLLIGGLGLAAFLLMRK